MYGHTHSRRWWFSLSFEGERRECKKLDINILKPQPTLGEIDLALKPTTRNPAAQLLGPPPYINASITWYTCVRARTIPGLLPKLTSAQGLRSATKKRCICWPSTASSSFSSDPSAIRLRSAATALLLRAERAKKRSGDVLALQKRRPFETGSQNFGCSNLQHSSTPSRLGCNSFL